MNARTIRNVAVIAGARTPFCKAGGAFIRRSAVQLGAVAARETMLRAGIRPERVDQIIFGIVSAPVGAPNIAREIGLEAAFPMGVPAYTVSQACISSNHSITSAADQIALGKADVILAGGAETLSDVPILYGRKFRDALFTASKARSVGDRLRAFRSVRLQDLAPVAPAIAEPSTGQTMGQSAEKMAKDFGIRRDAQDRFAANSHARAVAAWQAGEFAARVVPVPVPKGRELAMVERDDHPRDDTTEEKLAKLKPVFDRDFGTVTAGNASPLTDGASAVLLAAEEVARAEGWPILGVLRGYHYTAIDPFEHLLMGPVSAVAGVLDQTGLGLRDMGVIEMHEAFAAQVLSNLHGLASAKYCQDKLGRSSAVGEVDPEFVNQWGGSISLGHPFGATGGRLVLQLLDQLARKGAQFGLISACAAGGMGSALVFERV
ncbi:acetyl-CoA C-acyltransferase [Nannocystis sp.]|uniref:acetyl-CoA C-acyltransferase n=1 Tax=Nannocystis sp. TaxID=1962667 RepID=UPI0024228F0D|nr:acetyl-CoA C-acyltransferase [Nannocystis sp.]MBK7829872.1 acetyl-CoA C-acyltransferase [Nannocystis sp.]MBK9757767.1 acetyl-CoA C-acyltransferase [Nannocystis sp.]